ncbi:nc domain-containing protein [Leptolyngbya sp. Heron Island J]|uniref:nc domain-containing protein n=1 Tax=Leptolyngbya sp. Heron Island J TaxID=1385935 RepID=UPI0003B9F6C0|nr:nc domain-containing protein [Leptolyngbya sp. Heron Island J]ESA32461.1 nc domain-containing protein [Leptolyngbya sp. Heron Island J]
MSTKKVSKKELIKAIEQLEKNPHDRIRILGEIGVAGIGAAGAGAFAAVVSASSTAIPIYTALTGAVLTAAAPVTLVAGAAVAGGLATYGVAKLIKNGATQEAKRQEMKKRLEERLRNLEAKERHSAITPKDKDAFIVFLKPLLEHNLVTAEIAQQLIESIESGQMPLEETYKLLYDIISDAKGLPPGK